MERRPKYR
nr:unnamed protein product [Callosobruchus analis]